MSSERWPFRCWQESAYSSAQLQMTGQICDNSTFPTLWQLAFYMLKWWCWGKKFRCPVGRHALLTCEEVLRRDLAKEPHGWPTERGQSSRGHTRQGAGLARVAVSGPLRDRERLITRVTISSPPS